MFNTIHVGIIQGMRGTPIVQRGHIKEMVDILIQALPKNVHLHGNRKSATLVFTTHYCEVLNLFNRQDNIWIAKSDDKIRLDNMYETYNIRPELLKSRQLNNNAFVTAVNYENLMELKRELMS